MINNINPSEFAIKKSIITTTSGTAVNGHNAKLTKKGFLLNSNVTLLSNYMYSMSESNIKTKDITKIGIPQLQQPTDGERVEVQHIEIHTNLKNNNFNYNTFLNLSPNNQDKYNSVKNIKISNNNNNNNINNLNNDKKVICNGSALVSYIKDANMNNNNINITPDKRKILISAGTDKKPSVEVNVEEKKLKSSLYRTIDQEHAYSCIEDVHNYAKIKKHHYITSVGGNVGGRIAVHDFNNQSNGVRINGEVFYRNEQEDESYGDDDDVDDDDIDDDEEDDDGDDIDDEGDVVVENDCDTEDFGSSYENYFRKRQVKKTNRMNTVIEKISQNSSSEDLDNTVDIETVTVASKKSLNMFNPNMAVYKPDIINDGNNSTAPDHHARRPMNAFLIFCKRHRAIVKNRYKSLENRAITKILGDWWASLDNNDKICFTNLAQQNKDAFFSANPNFKWYKLPAPPLRSLNTRPANNDNGNYNEDNYDISSRNNLRSIGLDRHFKLADVTQMGELNTLISDKMDNNALQAALGETTQFLDIHMPQNNVRPNCKRSFSNHMCGKDDQRPRKMSRSCKGKIYQELMSSGQISVNPKKTKSMQKMGQYQQQEHSEFGNNNPHNHDIYGDEETSPLGRTSSKDSRIGTFIALSPESPDNLNGNGNGDLINFDLEEKIKELPELNLDDYLQRKRNTKKKKKITSKKRNSNSNSSNKSSTTAINSITKTPMTKAKEKDESVMESVKGKKQSVPELYTQVNVQSNNNSNHNNNKNTMVGSQKRKARKESITRRDVSGIENEIASVLALDSNFTKISGCYYYNETPTELINKPQQTYNVSSNDNIIMHGDNNVELLNNNEMNNISTTSDLLILAEVAANRTEISN